MKQLSIDEVTAAPKKHSFGCPHWTFDFKKYCTKCGASGELEPDEGPENLFRCDYEYEQCPSYKGGLNNA